MIVYYTRYNTIESFDRQSLLSLAFNCVTGMKNVPESFMNQSWNGSESEEWKSDRNIMTYQIDSVAGITAFRVAIVDSNDELWTTDIVLNDITHEIQLRLAREKRVISAEFNSNFRIPYIFKQLIRNRIGGMDIDLPVSDVPIYIDEGNISYIVNIIKKEKIYSLPVIYVSCPFSGAAYEVDVEELAKDMAGSAHVLVERSSATAKVLKELAEDRNAYNGAVDVFYSDDSFRYLRRAEVTANQFRYKITHAVYSRMAMRNIDSVSSISEIKLRNQIKKLDQNNTDTKKLTLEVASLKEQIKENTELFEMASDETKELQKRVNDLENENYNLSSKIEILTEALNKKTDKANAAVMLECSEKEFYPDEFKRIVYKSIQRYVSSYGDEECLRRDYHILNDIITNNECCEDGEKIKETILQIIRKNKLGKNDVNSLKSLGFELQKGSHDKYVFQNDDRYIITVSNSPGDYRDGENLAHDAVKLLFGRT